MSTSNSSHERFQWGAQDIEIIKEDAASLDKALSGPNKAKAWRESDHPRGQPDNPGQFGSGGGKKKPRSDRKPESESAKLQASAAGQKHTPLEVAAIRSYKHAGATSINQFLRTGKAIGGHEEEVKKIVSGLDSALAKSPIITGQTLYRGVGVLAWDLYETFPDPSKLKVGTVFSDNGFMSASDSYASAVKFADGKEDIVLKITSGNGLRGLQLDQFVEQQQKEGETLLPRGVTMTVTGIRNVSGKTVVDVVATMESKPASAESAKLQASAAKAGSMQGHPLVGASAEEVMRRVNPKAPSASPATWDNPNPLHYNQATFPKAVEPGKFSDSLLAAIKEQESRNAFQRLTLPQAYDAVKKDQPNLSYWDFQNGLAKLQADRVIRLGPYTQAIGTHEDPSKLMPLDREYKWYVSR